ncbi:hypothetical protein AXK12_01400 [Cephaloticoccus capnophilus]|uniref:Uncharacterized protein n=1 Tax=Cephaloticoccus capnophilus TaxID=1548208 RepID=A0A139STD0_9BACT|nr:hypothetical protein [Cephaloticoccus capnophilus]KXU37839.1 hypothetical protein AXK12_01400 [Cephaloticoccus capnophilus]
MDWILDHLQLVIAVAAGFAYWLSARQHQKAAGENEAEGQGGQPQAELHDEERAARERAERARQIREEIQRKIAERQGGPVVHPSRRPAAAPRPQPARAPAAQPQRAPARPNVSSSAAARPDLYAALAEQQRRLAAEQRRLAEARLQAEAIRAGAQSAQATSPQRGGAASGSARRGGFIRAQLRDPAGLKYAVVLREVLGPPVGLQNR